MFQGYSQETVDFMWGIRFNNERGWFLAHKDDYQQHLLAPTRELGQAVYDGLAAALPHEPLILKVSRIYRDARRLHGQGPYKDHLWFCVRTGDQDWTGRPAFYFEIAPDYYRLLGRFRRHHDPLSPADRPGPQDPGEAGAPI